MVPKPKSQGQKTPRGRDRKAQDGRGGRGSATPSALRQPASAPLLPASVRAVRTPAPAAVTAVAPAHHGPPHCPGPAATAAAASAAATGPAAHAPAGRRTPAAPAALVPVAGRWPPLSHPRVAYHVDGRRRPRFHHQRLVRPAPCQTRYSNTMYAPRISRSYIYYNNYYV